MSRLSKGRSENRTELAKTLGISVVTVDSWVAAGCPFIERGSKGREWTFDTAAVTRWREERAVQAVLSKSAEKMDVEEARRRKLSAEASLAEIERDLRLKEVVLVDEVVAIVAAELAIIRNRVLSMASRLAPKLSHGKLSANEAHAVVMAEVTGLLIELSAPEVIAAKATI